MGPFESGIRREAGEFGGHADVRDGGHVRDERVVLRHEADEGADLAGIGSDVVPEDLGCTLAGFPEAQKGIDQGAFAGSVGTEEAYGEAPQFQVEPAKDFALADLYVQIGKFDYGMGHSDLRPMAPVSICMGPAPCMLSAYPGRLSRNLQLEYGLGVGVGFLFGDLVDSWVHLDDQGPLHASDGKRFSGCVTEQDGAGCARANHSSSDTAKIKRYVEPSWLSGGPVPAFFARVAPLVGLRFKPIRDVEARLELGFSLTEGFFFNLSANYRLPYRTRLQSPPPEPERN